RPGHLGGRGVDPGVREHVVGELRLPGDEPEEEDGDAAGAVHPVPQPQQPIGVALPPPAERPGSDPPPEGALGERLPAPAGSVGVDAARPQPDDLPERGHLGELTEQALEQRRAAAFQTTYEDHRLRVGHVPSTIGVRNATRLTGHVIATPAIFPRIYGMLAEAGDPQWQSTIMPAPTVPLVASSMRMNPPVSRLRAYGSTNSGCVVRNVTRPISLRPSEVASFRCRVLMSSRYCTSRTRALTVRVVCFMSSRLRGGSRRPAAIQQTIASISWATCGWLCGRQIMSPREMSRSSANRSVTDMGGNASSTGPSNVSIPVIVVVRPEGRWSTSSPGFSTPPATCPA